jgi:hypothetical protein
MLRPVTGNLARLITAFALFMACLAATSNSTTELASGAQSDPPTAQKTHVYVSDFELFASAAAHPQKKAAAGEADKKQPNLVYADTDATTVQARRTMDFFANTLVQLLQKEGYTATRQTGNYPPAGVLLRGVFTEPDAKNRIRRALLGGGSTAPRFILYVGTFNLARQDQPLYQEAPVQSSDPRYGPVITVNAYIPLVKYDVDKNPSQEDVRKICGQIVSHLTSLISKNDLAISH